MPGTVLGTGNSVENKVLALLGLTFLLGETDGKQLYEANEGNFRH